MKCGNWGRKFSQVGVLKTQQNTKRLKTQENSLEKRRGAPTARQKDNGCAFTMQTKKKLRMNRILYHREREKGESKKKPPSE